MNALILSCGTGGGHNAAAEAIRGELLRRGWNAELLNPYILCGKNAAKWLNQTYIRLVQRFPAGFGMIYRLGEMCQRLPFRSPVYLANGRAAVRLGEYLRGKRFDVIIATHLFPGEMVTRLKHGGAELPPVDYIATDYTCVPFTEDLDCDAYVIPTEELVSEFVERGIPRERIYPLGIPVRAQFRKPLTKAEAKQTLWLDQRKTYFLISGGSMGAGKLLPMIQALWTLRKDSQHLIVVCGSNKRLYRKLQARYGDGMVLLRKTERMAECIRASDIYFTKPGGLSSTEAAVVGVALVHLPPIPGCESKNVEYFEAHGMSIRAEDLKKPPPAQCRSSTMRRRATGCFAGKGQICARTQRRRSAILRIKWQKNVNDTRKTDMKENIKRMPTDRGRTDSDTVSKEAKAAVPPSDAEGAPDRNEACPPVSKVASAGEETGGRDTAACEGTDHAQANEQRKRKLREKAKKVFQFLTNPRLLLCIAIAWMIMM